MEKHTIAKRYLNAFKASINKETLEKELSTLLELINGLEATPDILDYLNSPTISKENKSNSIEKLAKSLSLSNNIRLFLSLLVDKKRLDIFTEMKYNISDILNEIKNQESVIIHSPYNLTEQSKDEFIHYLEKQTGKKIRPTYKVSSEIIAGFRAKVGDIVYDGTLNNTLTKLRENILN